MNRTISCWNRWIALSVTLLLWALSGILPPMLVVVVAAAAAENNDDVTSEKTTKQSTQQPPEDTFDPHAHSWEDWGTYYDPQNIFCGEYDCYKILGFDYESFITGKTVPDTKTITKRYRSLSRVWHPDKNRDREAKEYFVKIARAYEVLTNDATRAEYDALRYNQELYYRRYGASVLWKYAPKSDTFFVVVFLLTIGSAISWWMQKQHWQNVANKLIQAAVEDWSPREGGTPESKELREKALEILAERDKEAAAAARDGQHSKSNGTATNGAAATMSKREGKRTVVKLTKTEKKNLQKEALRPIVTAFVEEIQDFGAGYHQPTWRDLLVVKLIRMPLHMVMFLVWNARYFFRRLRGLPLSDEEREVLTRRAVGEVNWVSATEEERRSMCTRSLWISANMVEWEEEMEVKLLSAGDQKKYNRLKKKRKTQDFFLKED